MSKRYSKEEVVDFFNEWEKTYSFNPDTHHEELQSFLKQTGLIIQYFKFSKWEQGNKDDWFDIDAYIGELNRQRLAAECDKSYNTPIVNEPNNKRKQYSVQDEIERKEREMARKELDSADSIGKVMEAIERAEDRGRMNSKHILTLQQAVNTLLDDKIEGTWWSRLMNRNN